jgi:hypothetical protein
LVCGTNSFNPRCRTYTSKKINKQTENLTSKTETTKTESSKGSKTTELKSNLGYNSEPQESEEDGKFRMNHEFSGKGSCPHDPQHNSTAIFTGTLLNLIVYLKMYTFLKQY